MADLRGWASVDPGPFRFGSPPPPGAPATMTDDELTDRVRELLPAVLDSWRYGGRGPEDAHLLRRGLQLVPDLQSLLQPEELHDLGLPSNAREEEVSRG